MHITLRIFEMMKLSCCTLRSGGNQDRTNTDITLLLVTDSFFVAILHMVHVSVSAGHILVMQEMFTSFPFIQIWYIFYQFIELLLDFTYFMFTYYRWGKCFSGKKSLFNCAHFFPGSMRLYLIQIVFFQDASCFKRPNPLSIDTRLGNNLFYFTQIHSAPVRYILQYMYDVWYKMYIASLH